MTFTVDPDIVAVYLFRDIETIIGLPVTAWVLKGGELQGFVQDFHQRLIQANYLRTRPENMWQKEELEFLGYDSKYFNWKDYQYAIERHQRNLERLEKIRKEIASAFTGKGLNEEIRI